MAVSVADVRIYLNDISTTEVGDSTISQKIDYAGAYATGLGIPAGSGHDRYTCALAAYRSFIVSRSYTLVEQGTIEVRRDLKMTADALLVEVDEILAEVLPGATGMLVGSTPMFDDRPEDPYA